MSSDKIQDRRVKCSQYISSVVQSVEDDIIRGARELAPQLVVMADQGALKYWLLNFADALFAQWENCERLIVNKSFQNTGSSYNGSIMRPLPRMSDFLQESQSESWSDETQREIFRYWDIYGYKKTTLERKLLPTRPRPSAKRENKCTSKRIVIARTYLSRGQEVLLGLLLRTTPLQWREPKSNVRIDQNLRSKLDFNLEGQEAGSFPHFIRSILPNQLPQSLLENFDVYQNNARYKKSKAPSLIFTANLHVSSDSFLIWATYQRLLGTKLALSQHGGLNGQHIVPTRGEEFEIGFSDFYLHWGWSTSENSKLIPCQLTMWKRSRRSSQKRTGILIITDSTFRNSRRPWGSVVDDMRYKQMVLSTYRAIPPLLKKDTVIRLHHDHNKYDTSHREMWQAMCSQIRLDDGVCPISRLRRKARLVVCTTLGTSEIVQFASQIPTVLRLDSEVHTNRTSCHALFQELESVGLIHTSDQSLRDFLEQYWDRIDDWWRSSKVGIARSNYMSQFGYMPDRPLRYLRAKLVDLANT